MKNKAFSLIELMVVIAIVAILSAVALPAYKNYVINTKFALGMNALLNFGDKVVEYHSKHGTVPTGVAQIGFKQNPGYALVTDNPVTLQDYVAPYLASAQIGSYSPASGGNCESFVVAGYISNYYNDSEASGIFFIDPMHFTTALITYFVKDGVIRSVCYFNPQNQNGVADPDTSITISNCFNAQLPNANAEIGAAFAAASSCP